MRENPMRISQIEERGSIGMDEVSAVFTDLQETVPVNSEIAGIWVALYGPSYMMQPAVLFVCRARSHRPQADLGCREPHFPGCTPIPKGRTDDRLAIGTREGRSDIDILKRFRIVDIAGENDFDGLPLMNPVIRCGSRDGADDHIAPRDSQGHFHENLEVLADGESS